MSDYAYAWKCGPRWTWRAIRYVHKPLPVLRCIWHTFVRGHISESCQECERPQPLVWHAPDPLWMELIGHGSGVLCPRCFQKKIDRAGIMVTWTPMVIARGKRGDWRFTSNHWHDATRDTLLMGVPDDDIEAHYPEQYPWNVVREALRPEGPQ